MSNSNCFPCVAFALSREALFFRRAFRQRHLVAGAPCQTWFLGNLASGVLVLETGLGEAAVESALDWALQRPVMNGTPSRPSFVVSAGFSGSLKPNLGVADLVLAEDVVDTFGNQWVATWPEEPSPLRRGRLLTTPALVSDPGEKRQLGERYHALAVDMETAAVARTCSRHDVRFGCLRAISDDWNTPLSHEMVEVLKKGRVAPLRLLGALLRRPRLTSELWRLARHTRRAARQLSDGLRDLLALTRPGIPAKTG